MVALARVILPAVVALLALAGCETTAGFRTREVNTHFLYFKRVKNTFEGGVGSLVVEVAPNPRGRAPVRIAESVSGGTGNAWRATVWMALLAASAVLDVDSSSVRVTVEVDGTVDGPSAGAMMTAAIIAAVRERPMLPNAVVTGTINPDLTLGPVGGIPEKVRAALDKGINRIGVPIGQASAPSLVTHAPVDVVDLVKKRGGAAFVMHDVGEAYEVITGEKLRTPEALPEAAMRFPDWAAKVFIKHALMTADTAEKTLPTLREELAGLERLPELKDASQVLRRSIDTIEGQLTEVKELARKGDAVSALYLAAETRAFEFMLITRILGDKGIAQRNWVLVRDFVKKLEQKVTESLAVLLPAWKAYGAREAVEVPFVVDTFEAFVHTMRELAESKDVLAAHPPLQALLSDRATPPTEAQIPVVARGLQPYLGQLGLAQVNAVLGAAYLEVGRAWIDLGRRSQAAAIDERALKAVTTEYERVADANLEYLDSILILEEARQKGEAPEATRRRLLGNDSDYRQAIVNRRLPAHLDQKLVAGPTKLYASLTGAVSSYFAAVTVVSKRYSLAAVYDRGGELVDVRYRDALKSMLAIADLKAREVAAQCQRTLGEVPISSLIEYDIARRGVQKAHALATQAGPPAAAIRQQIEALGHYWRASTMSRLALSARRRMQLLRSEP